MVEIDKKQVVCTAIPVHLKMDLKKVAALFGGRNARMLGAEKAEALTGFQVGGISPLAHAQPYLLCLTRAFSSWTSSTSTVVVVALLWNWPRQTPYAACRPRLPALPWIHPRPEQTKKHMGGVKGA